MAAVAFAAGPSVFEEPFTYANGNLSNAAAWTGGLFGDGSLVVASNVLTCTSGAGQSNRTELATQGNFDCGIEIPTVGTGTTELYTCFQDASNYYSLLFQENLIEFYQVIGASYLSLYSAVNTVASGQALGVRKSGTSFKVMHRVAGTWVERASVTDATYSRGPVALWSSSTTRTYDGLFIRASETGRNAEPSWGGPVTPITPGTAGAGGTRGTPGTPGSGGGRG